MKEAKLGCLKLNIPPACPLGQLAGVTHGNHQVDYGYLTNSGLANRLTFGHGGTNVMGTVKEIDLLNRLKSTITTNVAGQVLAPCPFPEGDAPQSPRLAEGTTDYLGLTRKTRSNLNEVASGARAEDESTPSGLIWSAGLLPKVARASQPLGFRPHPRWGWNACFGETFQNQGEIPPNPLVVFIPALRIQVTARRSLALP